MEVLITTDDMALVSFIISVLQDAKILFTVDPAYGVAAAGFVNYGISNYQRIMVHKLEFADACRLVDEARSKLNKM